MNKKIFTFLGIGLFLTLLIWEADKNSTVRIVWRGMDEIMPLAGLVFWILLFVFAICLVGQIIHQIVAVQKKEALSFSENREGAENLPINKLANQSEQLVLNRQDVDRAMLLLLEAMTTITAGDMRQARKKLSELKDIIGDDTLIDVLTLKIYKGEKDFDKMEALSLKLRDNPNLQLISLKASIEAQMQKKEFEQALESANQAFEVRQDLYWVIESAFTLRAKVGDWEGALQVLNSGYKKGLIAHEKYNELKAVALYEIADAAKQKGDAINFFKFCSQALDSCKTLVPAALALAAYYVENDHQIRKAAKILSRIWRCNPTADIAEAYLNLWPEDTAVEKVQRMETLALTNSLRPSLNNLILARLDMDAKLWGKAKSELETFTINNPATKKLARLIIEYEKSFNKNTLAAENWKKRIPECAEDGLWVCETCGKQHKKWQSVCKECGSVGQFKWRLYVEKEQ